ncbi:MAG: hypothetical protein K8R49_07050 [Candidatus Cloacimonetes bacterium]|nr:hypothetical protein [Candidatus Cloacimonadota bacterium]
MKKQVVFFMVVIMFSTSLLLAIPYTVMGNINIPDAYVLPHKMVDFSYVNYFVSDGVIPWESSDSVRYNEYDYAGVIRIGLFDRAEIGIVYTSTAGVFGNLKCRIINETETLPALSVGMLNLFSEISHFEKDELEAVAEKEDYDFTDPVDYIKNSPYIVISKSLVIITGIPIMDYLETSFHGGMGQRRFQGQGEIVKSFSGLFWGVDIKPSRYWGFDLEFDGQNANFGLNAFIQNFTFRFGMYELEDYLQAKGDESSTKFAINLKYTLDHFSELKASEKRKKTVAPRTRTRTTPNTEIYDGDANPLREELEQIRKRRKQAEKELEEIRKLLQE